MKKIMHWIRDHDDLFFAITMIIIFSLWMYILWQTTLLGEIKDPIGKTLQSITALLAPLAFYITTKNYLRKSGLYIIAKLSCKQHTVYPDHITKLVLFNEKDRAFSILNVFVIFDNRYAINLSKDNSQVLRAYDTISFNLLPPSFYSPSLNSKKSQTDLVNSKTIFSNNKQIFIQTAQGWYKSEKLKSQSNFTIRLKSTIPYDLIYLMDHNIQYDILTSRKQEISLILPALFTTAIVVEGPYNSLIIFLYITELEEVARVFHALPQKHADLTTIYTIEEEIDLSQLGYEEKEFLCHLPISQRSSEKNFYQNLINTSYPDYALVTLHFVRNKLYQPDRYIN